MKQFLAKAVLTAMVGASALFVPAQASAHDSCETAEDIPIVVEYGTLGGEDQVVCAQHSAGKTALTGLTEAGLKTSLTSGTPAMLCRIDGLPDETAEKCADNLSGDGYWAFMTAKEGKAWGYASVGLGEYKLAEGDFVALKYHLLADGQNVEVTAEPNADTRAAATTVGHDEAESSEDWSSDSAKEDGPKISLAMVLGGLAVLALLGIGVWVLSGRRD